MSSFKHFPKFSCPCQHISSPPPPYLCKTTPNHPHSKCPNHLNLPCLTTSATNCTYVSSKDTPHIHLTIIYILSSPDFSDSPPSLPRFQSHKSKHSGHKLCQFFLYIWYDAPWAVKIEDNFLRFSSSTSHSSSSCFFHTTTETKYVTQIAKFGHTLHLHPRLNLNLSQRQWLNRITIQTSPTIDVHIILQSTWDATTLHTN